MPFHHASQSLATTPPVPVVGDTVTALTDIWEGAEALTGTITAVYTADSVVVEFTDQHGTLRLAEVEPRKRGESVVLCGDSDFSLSRSWDTPA
jgi:hypothetical protein